MLEESAAQLAALRQRAESLLEQLGATPDASPSHAAPQGAAPQAAESTEDQQGTAPRSDNTFGHEPGNPTQTDRTGTNDPVPNAPEIAPHSPDPVGPATISRHLSEPSFRKETDPAPEAKSHHGDRGQSPREVEQSGPEDLYYNQTGQGPPGQPEPQEKQFPIQSVQPQSDSILDNPVTVAPPPDWLKFEVAPEYLSSDAELIEEEIAGLYEAIEKFQETRRENTGHALSLLREAREIITGQPHRIERAQYNIQQARQIIERAKSSRNRSIGIALRTFGLLILWLAALGGLGAALFLYPLEVNEIILLISTSTGWNTSHYYSLLWAVAAGGIGGWLGTFSFLFERMRVHEEFDHQYILRSMIQPLMGVILGLIAYGLLAVLFNSLNSSIIGHPVTSYLPAALALPTGLWQVYVYAAIFRITSLLTFQRRRRW